MKETHNTVGVGSQPTPFLMTTRLRLRRFASSDFAAMRAWDADPEVQRYRGARRIPEEETRHMLAYLEHLEQEHLRTRFAFALETRATPTVVGRCDLKYTDRHAGEASVSYVLARPYWGTGLMTEAVREVLRFGFTTLGLHRVWAKCNPENVGSWRVMEKVGMCREGHLRECEWAEGAWRDHLIYAILAHEWGGEAK